MKSCTHMQIVLQFTIPSTEEQPMDALSHAHSSFKGNGASGRSLVALESQQDNQLWPE